MEEIKGSIENKQDMIELDREMFEKYKLVADNTVECIWLLDLANEQYKYISPSIINLRGLTVEEAMKEKLADSLTEESLQKIKEMGELRVTRFLSGDTSREIVERVDEFQQYCKDGSLKDVEISTKLIFNETTNFVDVLGVSRDITERKKLELKLSKEIKEKNEVIEKLITSEKKLSKLTEELKLKNDMLKNIAITDELTGIHNRYFFDKKIIEEMDRADRYNEKLSLAIFDLDHFKRVNDFWGHDVGDSVLINVVMLVRNIMRKTDILARWGGEEFVILMNQTSLEGARKVAEKLRCSISEYMHPKVGQVTASFGVAERAVGEGVEKWFKRVDKALYRAKNEGRNCVACFENTQFGLVHLEWNDNLECGNGEVDWQHRRILELGNELIELSLTSVDSEKTMIQLNHLIEHIIYHFSYEEGILEKIGYNDLEKHKNLHKELSSKLLMLKESCTKGQIKATAFIAFIVDEVIMEHLVNQDTLFFTEIKSYGSILL